MRNNFKNVDEVLNYAISLHPKYIDFDLTRIRNLLSKLNNPEKKLKKIIHIAGTNGKGSTLAFVKSLAENYGLKVSCYSSPHLVKFNERILINGKMIQNYSLFNVLKEILKKNDGEKITFFEFTTAAAFLLMSEANADLNIIETGMGGRLDATNVMQNKKIIAITNIGYDHKEYLGNSLKKIVYEKTSRKNTGNW